MRPASATVKVGKPIFSAATRRLFLSKKQMKCTFQNLKVNIFNIHNTDLLQHVFELCEKYNVFTDKFLASISEF